MVNLVQDDPFCRRRPPLVIVISGPSGVGKDRVVQRMAERGFQLHFVVTATDRAPRTGEVHGIDYYFYSRAEFERMIAEGELLEYAWVYEQHKGIPRAHVAEALGSGHDVVMRLDVQGAATVKRLIPAAVTIFLTCESGEELERRLRERRTEAEDEIQARLKVSSDELTRASEFEYVVVNRRCGLDECVDDVAAIIRAEHCRAVPREAIL